MNKPRLPKENCEYTALIINRSSVVQMDRSSILKIVTDSDRAALTTHKLEWLEPRGKLAELELELELKCSNRELVYVGNTNETQST